MSKTDGGQAFPTVESSQSINFPGSRDVYASYGMTLRQYYKAAALQGMLVNGFMPNQVAQNYSERQGVPFDYTKAAGDMADAMLAEDLEFSKK